MNLLEQLPQHVIKTIRLARLAEFVAAGVRFNACSLYQLEQFGKVAPGQDGWVGIWPPLHGCGPALKEFVAVRCQHERKPRALPQREGG